MASAESTYAKRDRSVLSDDESDGGSKRDKPELSLLVNDEIHTDNFDISTPSPLTPLSDVSDSAIAPSDDLDMGDTKWYRHAALGFFLPGETTDSLDGPAFQHPSPQAESFKTPVNKLLRGIYDSIIDEWPTADSDEADRYTFALVNAHAFIWDLFESRLRRKVAKDKNQSGTSIAEGLVNKMTGESGESFRRDVFSNFMAYIKGPMRKPTTLPPHFKTCWEEAETYRKMLKRAKYSGNTCRKQAKWIGLERVLDDELKKHRDRYFVETLDQAAKGIESGLFKKDGFICVHGAMHRICAPLPSSNDMSSVILWTKDSPNDVKPEWNKVFGGVIYNVDELDDSFGSDNKLVTDEMQATVATMRSNAPVPRGDALRTGGTMVKTLGRHSGYGLSYNATIKVPEIRSQNPMRKTIEKVENIKQLRMRMKLSGPLLQGRHWEFLHGFLPPYATTQMTTARQASGTLNSLGYPNTSAFGTYAYCASSHIDCDDSTTSGWVMARSAQVKRNESNFVFNSHGLVVEMAERMFWFWNAPEDYHGTTVNELALKKPKTFQKYMSTAPDRAQWTRVTVLPSAVVAAAKRRDETE